MFLILFLIAFSSLSAEPAVYRSISNPLDPSWRDYKKIQYYLKKGDREELALLRQAIRSGGALYDYNCRARRFQLVGKWPWQGAKFKVVPFGCKLSDKKICVLSYASYNKNYPAGIEYLKKALERVGFRGHLVYRIGGWPNVEEGSLKLAHVPYAFKPCFLKEVKRMGYELVLWLDASIRPMKELDSVFKQIEEKGYLFYPSGHTLAQYCTKEAMDAMGEPVENAETIQSVAAGIFGVNLASAKGNELMEKWYDAARRETPFLSPRPDQNSLSILAHQLGMNEWETTGLSWESITDSTRFFIDWKSIH
jgi:hypothetical protein